MKFLSKFARAASAALLLGGVALAPSAQASTIFLIGSDVISFHSDQEFIKPVFIQLQGGSSKPVLFINSQGKTTLPGSVTPVDFKAPSFFNDAANTAASLLAAYSAIYFDSPSGCCNDPFSYLDAATNTKVAAFVSGGGNLGVGDYQGNAYWDAALGFTGGPGVTSGTPSAVCIDPGVSTPSGILFGFKPSYSEGCFVHQTYDPAFWTGHGFFALQRSVTLAGDFVTMASGFIEPGTSPGVPEPGTLALLGIAFAGIFGLRRRGLI